MRYSASEKFEIIELVEQSSLSIRRTLAPIGIPRSTFYDWYSRYQEGGEWGSLYKSPFDPPPTSVPITPVKKFSLRKIWNWYDLIVSLTLSLRLYSSMRRNCHFFIGSPQV